MNSSEDIEYCAEWVTNILHSHHCAAAFLNRKTFIRQVAVCIVAAGTVSHQFDSVNATN